MPLNDYYQFVNGGNTMGDMGSTTGGGTIASDRSGGHNSAAIGSAYQTDDARNDLLNRIKQYDPNATISQRTQTLGGDDAKQYSDYYLDYDASKLPTVGGAANKQTPTVASSTPGQQAFNSGGWNTYAPVAGNGGLSNLRDPSRVATDPTYGQLTAPTNVRAPQADWLDKYAGLFMGAASFGLGAIGGAVAGTGAMAGGQAAYGGARLPNAALGVARSVGSGQFNPLNLVGTAANIAGVPGARYISPAMNLANMYSRSSPSQQQQPQQVKQQSSNISAARMTAINQIIAKRRGQQGHG